MAVFQHLLSNIQDPKQLYDLRLKLMREIEAITGRRLIVYAAALNKDNDDVPINTMDKVGFADLLEGLNDNDIDVLLHSPGGSAEAAEMIVSMLREVGKSVRFIIPHSAKSAATLLALSGDSILMDEKSELGPTDPQVLVVTGNARMYVPAQTILDGFDNARKIMEKEGPQSIPAFMPLLSKYDLHLLEICQNAKELSTKLVKEWLFKYMFKSNPDMESKADYIAEYFADHHQFLSHGRSIGINQAKDLGLIIEDMRNNSELQKRVWELYCAIEMFFANSPAVKMFENTLGVNFSRNQVQQQIVLGQHLMPPPPQPGNSQHHNQNVKGGRHR